MRSRRGTTEAQDAAPSPQVNGTEIRGAALLPACTHSGIQQDKHEPQVLLFTTGTPRTTETFSLRRTVWSTTPVLPLFSTLHSAVCSLEFHLPQLNSSDFTKTQLQHINRIQSYLQF